MDGLVICIAESMGETLSHELKNIVKIQFKTMTLDNRRKNINPSTSLILSVQALNKLFNAKNGYITPLKIEKL